MDMEKKPITVFTPTYNRAYILGKCHESLNRQTCKDFVWLIIDDGSKDDTRALVEGWMKEDNGYEIRYVYKENGGLHTGYNKAIEVMDTELSVCIDSDDAMPENGIETILRVWNECRGEDMAGIVGLDFTETGKRIGTALPEAEKINAASLLCNPGTGDKKYVMRNDLWREVAPMPVYPGEKNFNPHYFVIRLSSKYKFKPINECLCVVDYQPDGMTANIWKQYNNSPNSFSELRRVILACPGLTFKYRFKTAAHYTASSLMAKRKHYMRDCPAKALTILAWPVGVGLMFYIKSKIKEK